MTTHKKLPPVAPGPAAGGALAFSLQSGDTFRIGSTDYLVTQVLHSNGVWTMRVEILDGSNRIHHFTKGGTVTRGAL